MKKIILSLFVVIAIIGNVSAQQAIVDKIDSPVDWANPLMGTDSEPLLSNGNTYPAIAMPWGMNFWTPQTGKMGDGWTYTYDSYKIRGFKQTHQPSPWINDYGQFVIMPTTGAVVFDQDSRRSWFSHKTEVSTPYYYSVYLADYDLTAEITPTERSAQMRFTYPQNNSSSIIIDAFDKGSYVKVDKANNKIVGYTTKNSGGVPPNFKNWFVIYVDKPISQVKMWCDSVLMDVESNEFKGNHAGAVVTFSTEKGEQVSLRIASSFISLEQAEISLKRELAKDNFDATKEKGRNIWNEELSRISVMKGNYQDVKTFYSSMYRLMLFPRKFYEIDAQDKVVHYSPYNGKVLPGYMFTDNGFWDTFRAVFPFFTLSYPTLTSHIMEGLVNTYKESGWLPEWASPGHRDCMIGSNSASIIVDAYMKGIDCYDIETLYEALVKNSENEGPLSSVGRRGVKYYNELGYIPYNVGVNENVARTLEYAYADYALMLLAQKLGKPSSEIEKFKTRSQYYRNVYDKQSGLMRGRNEDGTFQSPFNPFKWGDAFTEGNSWHYTWSVFHDVEGLVNLMGGKDKFINKLDSLFIVPPIFDHSYYGFTIHEIREMQIAGMGNYAHGNQPIQHGIYLYNYVGQPYKAQKWSREVLKKMYSATPDGYAGDEDNGQTSAWYVFSALGFYPVSPVMGEYVIGSPLFEESVIKLENGKTFTVKANNNSDKNIYIQSAKLNGKDYNNTFLTHKQITDGGEIVFEMGDKPNKNWGAKPENTPSSFSKK